MPLYSDEDSRMIMLWLQYDPFVCYITEDPSPNLDSTPNLDSIGMDATGPYSWKINTKLPVEDDMGYSDPTLSETPIPTSTWYEVMHELEREASIQELADDDDDDPIDPVLAPEEAIEEANVWFEERCIRILLLCIPYRIWGDIDLPKAQRTLALLAKKKD